MENEIDRILDKIKSEIDFSLESRYNFDSDKDFNSYTKAFIHLKTKGFIILERNKYSITDLGMEVIEIGGWNKYQHFFKQEKINEKEQKRIEFEKSKIDLRLKKWQLKTFWWIFGFAIIGSGLSIYNFTNNLLPSENVIKQEEQIEKMELKLEKLQTSILNQKKIDSLNNTKKLKNSLDKRKE